MNAIQIKLLAAILVVLCTIGGYMARQEARVVTKLQPTADEQAYGHQLHESVKRSTKTGYLVP